MLEEYKEAYRQKADYIAGWNKLSRSELCRKYIENIDNKDISESYLSAIIYKFWNVAEHNYFTQSYKGLATQQDCYDWNVEGILYALDKHVWDDPNNELYGDPNGPEKAINVTIYGQKLNFYNSLKTYKRQINSGLVSLEKLQEDASDAYYLPYNEDYNMTDAYMYNKVKEYFSKKLYLEAFVIDAVLNHNLFTPTEDRCEVFNRFKLTKHLHHLDDSFCMYFSKYYKIPRKKVEDSVRYIVNVNTDTLNRKIDGLFKGFLRDKEFSSYLMG